MDELWRGDGCDLQVYHPRKMYELGRPVRLKTSVARDDLTRLYRNVKINGKVENFIASALET